MDASSFDSRIDPQVRKILDAMRKADLAPTHDLSPLEARRQYERLARSRPPGDTRVETEDRTIPDVEGSALPIRIYRPSFRFGDSALPTLVYFHGGGHVVGSIDSHDGVARNLCAGAACAVVSVDYRLAPDHRFPAAVEDAFAAYVWCVEAGRAHGLDRQRIAVGGDSAGGNLAAVVALMARDAGIPSPCLQLLIYPVTDYAGDTESYRAFAQGYGFLEARSMFWFRDHYLRSENDRLDWRAAPLRAEDLRGLPPAFVLTAELDILKDEGAAFSKRLRAAQVEVEYHEIPGMIHGFFTMAPAVDGAVHAQRLVCEALRRASSTGDAKPEEESP